MSAGPQTVSDYERIAEAIEFIASHVERQPTLEETAAHLHLSVFHFQRLFSRWAGVSPKRFLQVLTVVRAKELLAESRPLLDVTHAVGLSSGSRLYDHFVQLEAMTPGEFKGQGDGLVVEYGVHDTPFGSAFVAATPRGVCAMAFINDGGVDAHVAAMSLQHPRAVITERPRRTAALVAAMFDPDRRARDPLTLHVRGTNFQVNVWRALLEIPIGHVSSYSRVATRVGAANGARAVGGAVGANPVAFVIPCHRVIQESGALGGYHWGVTRKLAINAWEEARIA